MSERERDLEAAAEAKRLRREELKRRAREAWEKVRVLIVKGMESGSYSILMMFATVYTLFATDFLYLALPKSVDATWAILTFCFLCLFTVDLILNSLAKPKYFLRLFFWLDLLATLSLVPDIPFLWDSITGNDSTADEGDVPDANSQAIARAGKAARAGTRAGRLIRLMKLFEIFKKKKSKRRQTSTKTETSVVGQKLADLTTRKVILGVMAMVIVLPFLDVDEQDTNDIVGLQHVQLAVIDSQSFYPSLEDAVSNSDSNSSQELLQAYNTTIDNQVDLYIDSRKNILQLTVEGIEFYPLDVERYEELRLGGKEVTTYILSEGDEPETVARFDIKSESQTEAILNMILIVFIVFLLGIGSALFSKDANTLMIGPIQRMVRTVKRLAENPLAKLDDESQGQTAEEAGYETAMVEAALRKIGGLLQIGFGEAGALVIGKNLGSGGEVDAMIPGNMMRGIFGFCDIREFTDTTECLQEEIMPFVNTIAQIVHEQVSLNGGSPNKNIGDAFLVVYRTSRPEDIEEVEEESMDDEEAEQQRASILADGALIAFLNVVKEIDESPELAEMIQDPALKERMPNYTVRMGFGLHYGWAIEGAIGSELKIDASYLSPHVNLAARLEAATKQYGVPLLLSGEFVALLSPDLAALCRKIDRVTVKGSKAPMMLYTVDLDPPPVVKHGFPGTEEYTAKFEEGVEAYLKGKWARSGNIFQQCLEWWPTDEPARTLLWYMSRHNFLAPKGWHGFRALDSK